MSYELMKELGIQRAYVAELEAKNRRLREIVEDSERKRAGFKEQLMVKDVTYAANVKELVAKVEDIRGQWDDLCLRNSRLERENKSLHENHKQQVSELNERISEQDVVIGDLTDDISTANQANTVLRDKLHSLQRKEKVLGKLEKVLDGFEL